MEYNVLSLHEQPNGKLGEYACGVYFFLFQTGENHYLTCDRWYFGKVIPSVIKGDYRMQYIVTDLGGNVIGTVIIKVGPDEKKLCALRVETKYQKQGIATKILLDKAFSILGTDKPYITIPYNKLSEWERIIYEYGWTIDGIIDSNNNYAFPEVVLNKENQHSQNEVMPLTKRLIR